ncbi:uncharacterized protein BXZ73DRAFT_81894 [Epithele typhae]|uniref:uncharacterized protein n=1 Tax=Epithele typhae TaxID=378194 RepID=UPI00200754BF|nr:uncharacterized protein BXZ73DRAFT_81894 [Epithele typhae]KAH9913565.1 hypothetical protein BXZ73DRAFT_81894 [Epithele typhae]
MSAGPALFPDVLLDVAAVASDAVIVQLMKANKFLYREAAKYLLDLILISIEDEMDLDSMVSFLSVYGGYRLVFLKGLGLNMSALSACIAKRLDALLKTHHDKIRIKGFQISHVESLLMGCPVVANLISRLSTLEVIELSEVGVFGSDMLRRSQSQFHTVEVNWNPVSGEETDQRSPIILLSHSKSSLRSLTATGASLLSGLFSPSNIYPSLTHLTLRYSDGLVTTILAQVFPNLTVLDIAPPVRQVEAAEASEFDMHRRMNILKQGARGSWPSLQKATALLFDFYALGILCPIRELRIRGPHTIRPSAFLDVLTHARPVHLCLERHEAGLFTPEIIHTLHSACAARTECFEVILSVGGLLAPARINGPALVVRPFPHLTSLAACIARISRAAHPPQESWIEAVRALPRLRALDIAVQSFLPGPVPVRSRARQRSVASSSSASDPGRFSAEVFFAALDLDALARRFREAVPALQTVALSLGGVRGRAPAFVRCGEPLPEFETSGAEAVRLFQEIMGGMRIG